MKSSPPENNTTGDVAPIPIQRTKAEFAALVLLGVGLIGILALHLLVALLTGLTVFVVHRALLHSLMRRMPERRARALALTMVLVTVTAALVGIGMLLDDFGFGAANGALARLLNLLAVSLDRLRAGVPVSIAEHLPESVDSVRAAAVEWLRAHMTDVRIWGTETLRVGVHVLVGLVIGLLVSTTRREEGPAPVFLAEWRRGLERLAGAFSAVMGAQVRIAALNSIMTAIYLFIIVPMIGERVPLSKTLVAVTFVAGLLPVIGNLVSNTAVTLAALVVSPSLALLSLAFLVAIHKFEYFLNARFVGARIQARTHELLVVMIVMEAIFGIGGLVAAPVYYAWMMGVLRQARWV